MTVEEKLGQLQQLPLGLGHGSRWRRVRSRREGRGGGSRGPARLRPEHLRREDHQRPPARRRRGVPARDSAGLRARRHPRLLDDVPGPAGAGRELRPGRGADGRRGLGRGGAFERRALDVLADDGRDARAALGPRRREQRRGPLPDGGLRRGEGAGLPGRAGRGRLRGLRRAEPRRRLRQALRRLRRCRGRPRLQHRGRLGVAPAQSSPAAVQSGAGSRRGHGDGLLQHHQRRPRARQLPHAHRDPEEGVGLRRRRRQRLERRPGADPARLRRGRRRGGPPRPRRGRRHGDDQHAPGHVRQEAAARGEDRRPSARRRGRPRPAPQVRPRALRRSVRR